MERGSDSESTKATEEGTSQYWFKTPFSISILDRIGIEFFCQGLTGRDGIATVRRFSIRRPKKWKYFHCRRA